MLSSILVVDANIQLCIFMKIFETSKYNSDYRRNLYFLKMFTVFYVKVNMAKWEHETINSVKILVVYRPERARAQINICEKSQYLLFNIGGNDE